VRSVSVAGRAAAIIAVALAILIDGYTVKARFINAAQLVNGNPVQTGGVAIGSVKDIKITDDGRAEITLSIKEDNAPLREGTKATIRQASQSGIANRYFDLEMPPNSQGRREIEEDSVIGTDDTTTQVDLDELFNTLDPETRKGLQGFFRGQARQFCEPNPQRSECTGRGEQANEGFKYLNPALATSSRLFNELTRDTPVLERFLVDSSRLVGSLAERRDDLAALIGNLNETTRALGNQKAALAESIELLPPFMRRANTTFVNLRAALDDVDPLVDASKPVARELGPFLTQARAFAADAEPTIRDLRLVIRRPGRNNDSIELVNSAPPLEDIALISKERSVAPGGRRESVGRTRGAFPEAIDAFRGSTPIFAQSRPYTTDLMGWFDDFSTTGPGFDALGLNARAQLGFHEIFGVEDGVPRLNAGPLRSGQYKRCPGGAEAPAADGSNVFSAEEMAQLRCEESARATGNLK
jgi:phospholipid/cholesterol/gamma-HCH transport system substrate-binding protein